MPSFQETTIIGHVGKNPELREVGSSQVANFSVAVTDKYTDKNTGELVEKTNWYDVSAWGKQADIIKQYVNKGDAIFCKGNVEARAYMGNDGTPRASLSLKLFSFQLLGSRGNNSQADNEQYEGMGTDTEDIPF